jgi:hypothetical protein
MRFGGISKELRRDILEERPDLLHWHGGGVTTELLVWKFCWGMLLK